VDDRAAATLAHLGDRIAAREVAALQVDRERPVPDGFVRVLHGAVGLDAGAARQQVDAAEALDSPAHERRHVARPRHVGNLPVDGAEPAQLARGLLDARRVVRAEDDRRTGARQALDGRPSHPGRPAGDDRHTTLELRELGHGVTACIPRE
jgi:hypothetical protein